MPVFYSFKLTFPLTLDIDLFCAQSAWNPFPPSQSLQITNGGTADQPGWGSLVSFARRSTQAPLILEIIWRQSTQIWPKMFKVKNHRMSKFKKNQFESQFRWDSKEWFGWRPQQVKQAKRLINNVVKEMQDNFIGMSSPSFTNLLSIND